MWKVIAAAPAGTDVALVLSRALAHAGDRALRVEPLLVTIRGSRGASSASPCAL
jgi:hypothetical protein